MDSWRYDYVDSTFEVEKNGYIAVEVYNYSDYIGISKDNHKRDLSDYFNIKIPKQNIVEIQHFKIEQNKKGNNLVRGAIGAVVLGGLMLTPLGPIVAGAKLVAMGDCC